MTLPTLAAYKPGCSVLSSPDWHVISNKQWNPKGIKAYILYMTPQGFSALAGVASAHPPGYRIMIATYVDRYFTVSYDSDDFKATQKQILQETRESPGWIDDYSKEFWELTKKFIPVTKDAWFSFSSKDKPEIRKMLVDVFDKGIAPNSYGYLTEALIDKWVISVLKEFAPSLAQQQIELLLSPVTPSFIQDFNEQLLAADSDEKLKRVLGQFYWVKGSYYNLPVLAIEDLRKERQGLSVQKADYAEIRRKKEEIISLSPQPDALRAFIHLIEKAIAIQDERKANVIRLNYALCRIARLVSAVCPGWSAEELLDCTPHELLDVLDGKPPQKKLVQERSAKCAWILTPKEYCITTDAAAFQRLSELFSAKTQDFVTGSCACKGVAKGIVKIVLSEDDFGKVKEGDILVTSMTRPEFLPVMKKSAAFVTNEGGIACHAAIIARELKKPCVIGTKIATKVLKDGDLVEVDADKGVVRKVK